MVGVGVDDVLMVLYFALFSLRGCISVIFTLRGYVRTFGDFSLVRAVLIIHDKFLKGLR